MVLNQIIPLCVFLGVVVFRNYETKPKINLLLKLILAFLLGTVHFIRATDAINHTPKEFLSLDMLSLMKIVSLMSLLPKKLSHPNPLTWLHTKSFSKLHHPKHQRAVLIYHCTPHNQFYIPFLVTHFIPLTLAPHQSRPKQIFHLTFCIILQPLCRLFQTNMTLPHLSLLYPSHPLLLRTLSSLIPLIVLLVVSQSIHTLPITSPLVSRLLSIFFLLLHHVLCPPAL